MWTYILKCLPKKWRVCQGIRNLPQWWLLHSVVTHNMLTEVMNITYVTCYCWSISIYHVSFGRYNFRQNSTWLFQLKRCLLASWKNMFITQQFVTKTTIWFRVECPQTKSPFWQITISSSAIHFLKLKAKNWSFLYHRSKLN